MATTAGLSCQRAATHGAVWLCARAKPIAAVPHDFVCASLMFRCETVDFSL